MVRDKFLFQLLEQKFFFILLDLFKKNLMNSDDFSECDCFKLDLIDSSSSPTDKENCLYIVGSQYDLLSIYNVNMLIEFNFVFTKKNHDDFHLKQ